MVREEDQEVLVTIEGEELEDLEIADSEVHVASSPSRKRDILRVKGGGPGHSNIMTKTSAMCTIGDRPEREPRGPMPSDASEWRNVQRNTGPSVFEDRRQASGHTFDTRPRSNYPPATSSPPQNSGSKVFPTRPPFTAYAGNLSYECTEVALVEFFEGLAIRTIRLPTDPDGRSKGFAYVEFEDLESLRNSMSADGFELLGRTIRMDVAPQSRCCLAILDA